MRLPGERVVLRSLTPADVEPYVQAFLDDPPMLVAVGDEQGPTAKEVRASLRRQPKLREAGERMLLVMADPETDAFIGELALHHFSWQHRRAEVGFFVVAGARRRGVALESVNLATEWAFAELGIHRMQLVTLPDNAPTRSLAERAGFAFEGTLRDYTFERGEFKDNVVFARLGSSREARRGGERSETR